MKKKKEVEKPKEEKKPEVKEEKKPEAKEEEKPKSKKEKLEDLGTLGSAKIKIHKLGKKVVHGVEYNDVHLINGETMLLSDRDLEKQKN